MISPACDTHVWIWLINGDNAHLPWSVVSDIERAAKNGGVYVSAISVWEVGMLERKGRIRLADDCLTWVRSALAAPGLRLLPISPEIAIDSTRLPGSFHGDPADRTLVASARLRSLALATHDQKILSYHAEH